MTFLGGHAYAFPAATFQGGQVETGPVGTVLLELAWPEMRPLTTAERGAWPARDTLRVLANSAAETAGQAVPEQTLLAKIPAELSVAIAPSSGIDARASGHIPPPVPASDNPAPAGAVPGEGMVRVQSEGRRPADATQHDVFVRAPIANPQEFIQCARAGSVPAPDCSQTFIANDLILKISYPRKLITRWRDIHARTAAFLQSHEVTR